MWSKFTIRNGVLLKFDPRKEGSNAFPREITAIGDHAFQNCRTLTQVALPDHITSIGRSAFAGCTSITSLKLPGNTETIGISAFYDCSALTSLEIPGKVSSIGKFSFFGCSDLKEIRVAEENPAYADLDGVLYDKTFTKLICCPARKKSITIPETVTSIGRGAFRDCGELMEIKLPENLTSIGTEAFRNCVNLKSIRIPRRVTQIRIDTFSRCTNLKEVILPNSMETIAESAFYHCPNPYVQFRGCQCPNRIMFRIPDMLSSGELSGDEVLRKACVIFVMYELHPEDPVIAGFIQKHFVKLFQLFLEGDQLTPAEKMLNCTDYITKENIDELIRCTIDQEAYDFQLRLTDYKHREIGYDTIEDTIKNKFDL